jgi:plastocyanin
MRLTVRVLILTTGIFLSMAGAASTSLAVEPGVDIAVPRVPISSVDGVAFRFMPANLVVEQGDYVRWVRTGGSHTTTSGPPCTADMLWHSGLTSTTTQFTRQFLEAPGVRPYLCSPHCGLGMTGQVTITTVIDLIVSDTGGAFQLTWTGGGGLYRVYRSASPAFTTATVLTASGGTNQTGFLDQTGGTPPPGSASFYLVMNEF